MTPNNPMSNPAPAPRIGTGHSSRVVDPSTAERILAALTEQRAAGGRRLGMIVAHGDAAAEQLASELLLAAGLAPARRLARLLPRPDETEPRPADVADFVRHYGHEYVTAVMPSQVFPDADTRAQFEDTALREGCDVHWH